MNLQRGLLIFNNLHISSRSPESGVRCSLGDGVILALLAMAGVAGMADAATPPPPCGPLPTRAQLAWADGDFALFLQLGLSTFSGEDRPSGNSDPAIFNPAKLDAKQWVQVAKDIGAKRLILTAKSHDGFCLWPSRQTDYTIKRSPWRQGAGDVVKEFTTACREGGLEAGLYVSCLDLHHPAYGTAAYNAAFTNQLRELLTGYGPLSELKFDNTGGEGAGANGSPTPLPSDRKQVYDWAGYFATAGQLQPNAILVSVIGPGARWNGNNNGHLGEPNWAPFDPKWLPGPEPANAQQLRVLNFGGPDGALWLPCECLVPLRPHWSWHAEDDAQSMALDRLVSTYCKSVGRGAVLSVEVPLNPDGLISEADARRLRELHAEVNRNFHADLALGKAVTASNARGNDAAFGPNRAVDGKHDGYWATDDNATNECWLEVNLGKPTQFDASEIAEPIALGQRIAAYRIEAHDGEEWKTIAHGATVGRLRVDRFKAVTADRARLVIEKSRACPAIARFSLYSSAGTNSSGSSN